MTAPLIALNPASPRVSAYNEAEADMLRDFYKLWERLHELPKDSLHRAHNEKAAQALVEQAHLLRRFYAN